MNQRLVAAVVVGAVVGAIVGVLITGAISPRAGNNPVMHAAGSGQGCSWVSKPDAKVQAGRTLTVVIHNDCDDIVASAGNFRHEGTSSPDNCDEAGPDFPFDDPAMKERDRRTIAIPGGESRVLNFKRAVKGAANKYEYDMCIGGRKLDPRLVIE
jgi:hypothetical protein